MKRLLLILLLIPLPAFAQSDADIRQKIIDQSIHSYSGNCPCPYNRMRNGRKCGGNSAYSKPGGASPKCFPEDISDEEVEDYRARNG